MTGRARRIGLAACAAFGWLAWGRAASADGSVVVLLREPGAGAAVDHAETRLAAELRAAGFDVEERTAEQPDDARRLVEAAEPGAAFATVLLRPAGRGAATDVWVADHVTHKTVVRRITARGRGDAADRAMALRVVELMRASLVEGVVLPPPPEDAAIAPEPPPSLPPDVRAWTREAVEPSPEAAAPAPFSVALGAAGAFGGPDVGLAVAPMLRVAWRPAARWELAVLGAGPALGARVGAREGSATVRQELALVEATFDPLRADPVQPYLAAGAGVYHLDATGYASAPFTSGQGDAWAALVGAGLGARLRLARSASLALDARELVAMPRPVLSFAGQSVGVSMRPGTLASVSLVVELR